MDAWGGNKNIVQDARAIGIKAMILPERSTSELQPLFVGFMRQYKLFASRLTYQAHFDDLLSDLTRRESIINMHSLIWNQLSSPIYRDMFRWCWL